MEAGTRHNVGVHAKNGVYEFLEVDQFDQAETRIVGIKKKVDVAVRSRLLARHGSEEVEMSHPKMMQLRLMRTKRPDHLLSIHAGPARIR